MGGCRSQPVDADQAGDRAVEALDHRDRVVEAGSILLEEVPHREPAAHAGRIGDHDVAHPHVAEREAGTRHFPLGARRGDQEPADQRSPQTAEPEAGDESDRADAHEQPPEADSHLSRGRNGAVTVAVAEPEQRREDAAAVERRRRDQVEQGEDPVDQREPRQRRAEQAGSAEHRQRERAEAERRREPDARRRAGRGDAQLGAGRGRLAPELGHAAQHPQGDAVDLHAVAARDQRVGDLVREHRGEEQSCRDESDEPVRGRGLARELRREAIGGEAQGEQSRDQQQAQVEPHRDPEDPTQTNAAHTHRRQERRPNPQCSKHPAEDPPVHWILTPRG